MIDLAKLYKQRKAPALLLTFLLPPPPWLFCMNIHVLAFSVRTVICVMVCVSYKLVKLTPAAHLCYNKKRNQHFCMIPHFYFVF